jgi:opacity protein-like surface antigen
MTTRFLATALLASVAFLPMVAFAAADYGSMPVEGITINTATVPAKTINTTTPTSYNDVTTSSASSNKKFYLEGRAGWSTLKEDDGEDDAIPFGAAIGYRLSPNTRIEGEFAYRKFDYPSTDPILGNGSGDETAMTAMLNGYYDFANSSRFTPYLGAGIGATRTAVDMRYDDGVSVLTADDDTIYLGYNLMAGVSAAVSDNIDLTLGYRWLSNLTDGEITYVDSVAGSSTVEGATEAHEVLAGVRYNF